MWNCLRHLSDWKLFLQPMFDMREAFGPACNIGVFIENNPFAAQFAVKEQRLSISENGMCLHTPDWDLAFVQKDKILRKIHRILWDLLLEDFIAGTKYVVLWHLLSILYCMQKLDQVFCISIKMLRKSHLTYFYAALQLQPNVLSCGILSNCNHIPDFCQIKLQIFCEFLQQIVLCCGILSSYNQLPDLCQIKLQIFSESPPSDWKLGSSMFVGLTSCTIALCFA